MTTIDCERMEALISASIDREISVADARDLAAHLDACESCRELAERCRAHDRQLREAFADRERAAEAFGERLAASFASAPTPRAWSDWVLPVAASLAIGFFLGWIVVSAARPDQPPSLADPSGIEPSPSQPGASGPSVPPSAPTPEPAAVEPTPRVAISVDDPRIASLAFATGPVEIHAGDDGEWRALELGAAVPAGARIRSAPETLCEIRNAEGSLVRLDRGTEVRLVSARSWELTRGRIASTVVRGSTPFDVRAADALVTALGTRFQVARSRGASVQVAVFEGSTRIESNRAARVLRRGERAVVGETIRVSAMDRQQLALAASWTNALLALEERDGAELEERLDELLAGVGKSKMNLLLEQEIRELGSSCVVPLLRYIESSRSLENPVKRVKAARIVSDFATEASIDDLIHLLADRDEGVRVPVARALERLTGTNQGLEAKRWGSRNWEELEPAYLRWLEWARQRAARSPDSSDGEGPAAPTGDGDG